MVDKHLLEKLKERYLTFAQVEAKGHSPIYHTLTNAIAHDDDVLVRLAPLPFNKQQPNLLLAAVRLRHGVLTDPDEFCQRLLEDWDGIRAIILTRSTQTNEAARCAVLLPVLAQLPQPLALFEVGAAAGLCLFPDHYGYNFSGTILSPADSAPIFRCAVNAKVPVPAGLPKVIWRGGIDLNPLSVREKADMEWLRLLVWPEQSHRLANLNQAIEIARQDPPGITRGDLRNDTETALENMPTNATVVVFHSAVLAYLDRSDRAQFVDMLSTRDVTWISNEHPGVLADIQNDARSLVPADKFLLSVNGEPVAATGPHGQSLDWL